MTRVELTDGWTMLGTDPGAIPDAAQLPGPGAAGWIAAEVPGTVACALGPVAADADLDGRDWWYRRRLRVEPTGAATEAVLVCEGLATLAEVYLNGRLLLRSESMFAHHEIAVDELLTGGDDLVICLRALSPRLRERRRPRARWRTRLVAEGNLRFFRTMLLGRAPGFAPGPPVVGPWRPVGLVRRHGLVLEEERVRTRIAGDQETGEVVVRGRLRPCGAATLPAAVPVSVRRVGAGVADGIAAEEMVAVRADSGAIDACVRVSWPRRWWPHTHGAPELYEVVVGDPGAPLHSVRVGFRTLVAAADLEADGLALTINGVPVFARGAVWIPQSLERPHATADKLRPMLERLVGAGMNMLRLPGTATYESPEFHDLCDELGILVLQDFMFANLDYPETDPAFMTAVAEEARSELARLGHRPSLAALCGGSEVAQQVAMLGLDPSLAQGPLYGELLPRLVAEAGVDAPYIPSAPWGGDLPFRPDVGVANYYGVGAYLRPLEDARRSAVRFATECLAFANVPDDPALQDLAMPGGISITHPGWKAGVPRDAGAGWDFEDVRDHYLRLLFGVDPVSLRTIDQHRYLELSRLVSGEVMAETFGEWRRPQSPCAGALVLWAKDLVAGAGWGVLDHRGEPKVALHHLRRVLAPVAVWSTDEGLGGIIAHVGNDRAHELRCRLRVALYRDWRTLVTEAEEDLALNPHSVVSRNVEAMLGRFVDAAWAYRFGPPGHDVVAISLELPGDRGPELISQTFRLPAGRPGIVLSPAALGLRAQAVEVDGDPAVQIRADAFAYGVRVAAPGHRPSDDSFGIEPGRDRVVRLRPLAGEPPDAPGTITAVNMSGQVRWPLT